jgi:hypothetical protein
MSFLFLTFSAGSKALAQCKCDIYDFTRTATGNNAVEAIKAWQTKYDATWSCAKSKSKRVYPRRNSLLQRTGLMVASARRCIQLR